MTQLRILEALSSLDSFLTALVTAQRKDAQNAAMDGTSLSLLTSSLSALISLFTSMAMLAQTSESSHLAPATPLTTTA